MILGEELEDIIFVYSFDSMIGYYFIDDDTKGV